MSDENNMPKKHLSPSKELLYSDYTGTTVVEHVLNSLQKTTHSARSEEIYKFLRTKGEKSGALDRAKKLISLMDENDKGTCLEASVDDDEAIEVHLTIDKEDADVTNENYKADAWFILSQSEGQDSDKCFSGLLDTDGSSSDSDSDSCDEYFQNGSAQNKNLIIEDECSDHDNECDEKLLQNISAQQKTELLKMPVDDECETL